MAYGLAYEKKAVAVGTPNLLKVVSRLGLEPRALALKGLIRVLGWEGMDCDGQIQSPPQGQ